MPGATKYADLSMNRNSNYRFSYDKMLALNGSTAPHHDPTLTLTISPRPRPRP